MAFSIRPLHRFVIRLYTLGRADGETLTVTSSTSEKIIREFCDGTEYYKTVYNQASADGKPHAELVTLNLFNNSISNIDVEV